MRHSISAKTLGGLGLMLIAGMGCGTASRSVGTSRSNSIQAGHYTGPIIDVHAHVFFEEEAARATPEALLEQTRSVRLAAVGVVVMAARPGIEETRRLNDQLRELVQRDRRLFGIGSVHPGDGAAALQELERIKGMGFRLLKLHPNTQELNMAGDEVAAVVQKAGELDLPILFDFSGAFKAADIGPYILLAIKNPKAKIILAHMGGTKFNDVLLLSVLKAEEYYPNNLWVDLSAVASMYADSPLEEQLVWVIRQLGVDRVLFGSDFPIRTPAEAIGDVERLGLTLEEQRKIFYENAASLLGLGSTGERR
jgi:predicted TIM-barrel fold metal-dependent hydrolase